MANVSPRPPTLQKRALPSCAGDIVTSQPKTTILAHVLPEISQDSLLGALMLSITLEKDGNIEKPCVNCNMLSS